VRVHLLYRVNLPTHQHIAARFFQPQLFADAVDARFYSRSKPDQLKLTSLQSYPIRHVAWLTLTMSDAHFGCRYPPIIHPALLIVQP